MVEIGRKNKGGAIILGETFRRSSKYYRGQAFFVSAILRGTTWGK